jgi:hypothetical protein
MDTMAKTPDWKIVAHDKEDLFREFGSLGVRVPPRDEPKDQMAEEFFCMRRCLFASAEQGLLAYPFSARKGESPDFLISEADGPSVGVEVTKATTEEFEADSTRLTKGLSTRHFSSLDDDIMVIGEWAGEDSAEHEWARHIAEAIRQKDALLPRYKENAQECDLLIYDNTPTPALNFERAISALKALGIEHGFRRVSVIRGNMVICDIFGSSLKIEYRPEWDSVEEGCPNAESE